MERKEKTDWTRLGPGEERQTCLSGDPSDSSCKYYNITVTEIYIYLSIIRSPLNILSCIHLVDLSPTVSTLNIYLYSLPAGF